MKILALILARGGSKRLPRKNIRLLGGKPLIVWSIDVVKDISEICDILVSTDDSAIAAVSKEAGALVPWMRPLDLATDTASSFDAALHALDWYESVNGAIDALLLLQPTSPFRTTDTVRRGIELFKANEQLAVIGVSPAHTHPMWSFKMDGGFLAPFMEDNGLGTRSQDLPAVYAPNGCFYLSSPMQLRTRRSFIGSKTIPLLIESPQEAIDIDTEWDFNMADLILKCNSSIGRVEVR